ncbi:hypothetical protein F2Q69_00031604 [Brassica cretica]|uniref:CCHC-type domain-containing protein n=1 Tax=Brassica cretica TaxID=69181 RepID=A0A8S9S9R9_BRACR|nr:hypothetical protein F2Q69_00031604 [Brassica cretica]
MYGNMKDKIAVRNNTGKTTPATTAPMANAYANAIKKEAQQIDYTDRSLRSDRALAKLGRYVATEPQPNLVATDRACSQLGRYVATDHAHSSVATHRPSMHTARSLRSDQARTRLGRYVANELKPTLHPLHSDLPQKVPPLGSLLNPHRNAFRFVSIKVSVEILRRKQVGLFLACFHSLRSDLSDLHSLHSDLSGLRKRPVRPQKGPPLGSLLNPHRNAFHFVLIGVSVEILRRKQGVPEQQLPQGLQQPPLPPPPPLPVYRVYDERFYRLTTQMWNMDMEHFGGTVDATVAFDWKLGLQRKLEIIECPPEVSLRLAMQYLRGDALVWWEGVRLGHRGPDPLTFVDFIREFDRKYFPKEAMDKKKSDFEHVSQGDMSIREYEVEFNRLRRFAGDGISEEDLIRKFLGGMRVEIRNRCRVVTYHRLGDLVEKAAEQEAGLAEEHKLLKSAQPKSGKNAESQKKAGDQSERPRCTRCLHYHFGECLKCNKCGRFGHFERLCRSQRVTATPSAQAAPTATMVASGACFTCGQHGHFSRNCPTNGPAAKRQAVAPRVYALGEANGAEPTAGDGITEEDLIRKFLGGMRVEIRNRCRVVTYQRLGDLVEKVAEQEAGLAEEQKLLKSAQPKPGKNAQSQKKAGDQPERPKCTRCLRYHFGEFLKCNKCGRFGHLKRFCRSQIVAVTPPAQVAPRAIVVASGACFTCGQHGHFSRNCPTNGPAAKRQAVAPHVYALGEANGVEPTAGSVSVGGEVAHTLF